MSTETAKEIVKSALVSATAWAVRHYYEALIEAGFDNDQALALTISYQAIILQPVPEGGEGASDD